MAGGSGTVAGGRASGETGSESAATRDVSIRRATQSLSNELPRASAACFSVKAPAAMSSST
eukprot:10955449-Alexandrium_andersonii.AAC.1